MTKWTLLISVPLKNGKLGINSETQTLKPLIYFTTRSFLKGLEYIILILLVQWSIITDYCFIVRELISCVFWGECSKFAPFICIHVFWIENKLKCMEKGIENLFTAELAGIRMESWIEMKNLGLYCADDWGNARDAVIGGRGQSH